MAWHYAIGFFFLSSIKFLLAPTAAVAALGYWEAIIVTSLGGWAGVCVFYFGASYFFRRAEAKRARKEALMIAKGMLYVPRKKFTRSNRFIIRTKRRFGLIGFSIITPAIISIPIGCVLMAKFYPNWKVTIPLLFAFVVGWSFFLATFGAYIFEAIGWMPSS